MNLYRLAYPCEDDAPFCRTCFVLCLIQRYFGIWLNQSCHPIPVQPLHKGLQPSALGYLKRALAC